MKKLSSILLGLVILGFLLGVMITFTVPYNEVVVVTTFNRADDDSVYWGKTGTGRGVMGNLHLKWFAPIQKTQRYSALVQTLETRLEQIQTRDKQAVIPQLFVAWKIDDPLAFYRRLRTEDEAVKQLQARLRDAKTQIARYSLTELTNPNPAELKLAEAEAQIRASIQEALDEQGYGIALQTVGIKRLVLPADVSESVFERMRATRSRLAAKAREEGAAEAEAIRARAEAQAREILSFADKRAAAIRTEGVRAVQDLYRQFKEDEDFARFQLQLAAIEEILANNPTIIADPKMVPFDLFEEMGVQLRAGSGGANHRR